MRSVVAAALVAAAFIFALAAPVAAQPANGVAQVLPQSPLTVNTQTGSHQFRVMVADDGAERATGLMFREEMAIDEGMLFVFGREEPRAFWMKNTPLSLDIIFLDRAGIVVNVAKRTTPFSLETVPSTGDAKYVLEVNAGVSDLIRLRPGDRVEHPAVGR